MALFGAGSGCRDPLIQSMEKQINSVCQQHNPSYKACFVSWNDNQRQQGSCWGSNITDARLKGRDGEDFLVVRSQNFDERLGRVRAADVALLVGDQLKPITLEDYLRDFGVHGSYAGAPAAQLLADRDQSVGIRFQAVFLPVKRKGVFGDAVKEFYPDTFNYQTQSWTEPKNLVLLCTSQGTFVQQDGPGSVPQYLHKREQGQWRKKYLEAMMTSHGVTMGQQESASEREMALRKGKAVSTVFGTRAMGTGFNRLMTIQVPLKQTVVANTAWGLGGLGGPPLLLGGPPVGPPAPMWPSIALTGCGEASFAGAAPQAMACDAFGGFSGGPPMGGAPPMGGGLFGSTAAAHAARVSTGSDAGPMEALKLQSLERDRECSITITVQFYFVVEQGCAIDPADVRKAIDVCEEAYKGCNWDGNLMDPNFQSAFAKKDMTLKDLMKISKPDPTLTFPSPGNSLPWPAWPSPPSVAFPTASFDPLAGLNAELKMQVMKVPAQQEGYNWLHSLALQLLEKKSDLDIAFHLFRLSNDLHLQPQGVYDATSLYNMACCQSVAVQLQIERYQSHLGAAALASCTACPAAAGGLVAPNMPPSSAVTVAALCEGRLDSGLKLLSQAVASGWRQDGHMATDPDLKAMRELRFTRFERVRQLCQAMD